MKALRIFERALIAALVIVIGFNEMPSVIALTDHLPRWVRSVGLGIGEAIALVVILGLFDIITGRAPKNNH